jgi:protein disulfide-isomerase A1
MKGTKLFAIMLVVAISFASCVDFPEEEGVLVLGDDNFDAAVKHYEHVLVEFYAPWCGHCKKLAPEYARAAQILKKGDAPIALAKVDCTIHKTVASRFGIEGFPTLKLFTNGVASEYNGGRTESEIVSWMKKKTGPATKVLTTVAEVEAFHGESEVAVVYFGDNAADLEVFQRVARSNDDTLFGSIANEEAYTKFGVKAGTVVLFKNFDDKRNDTTEITEEGLKAFITKNASPLVMKFDEKCAQLVFGKATPGLFLYRDRNSEKAAELDAIFTAIAAKVQGKIQVVITDITEGLETRLAEYIGVTSKDLPTVRIHDTRTDLKKFNMDAEITEANILDFVNDWETGKLKANLKSEEIPQTQDGDVIVLVGKSFQTIVFDDTKDVLVEFYAPWCGHCKKLTPIYDELAKNLKHNKNLIIAKMDSTTNETDAVSIQGFPTIKFWPAGKKTAPMDFNDDRTVEGFTQFLVKHSTNTVTLKQDDL